MLNDEFSSSFRIQHFSGVSDLQPGGGPIIAARRFQLTRRKNPFVAYRHHLVMPMLRDSSR